MSERMALFGHNVFVVCSTQCLSARNSCSADPNAVADTASSPLVTRKALQQAHGRAAEYGDINEEQARVLAKAAAKERQSRVAGERAEAVMLRQANREAVAEARSRETAAYAASSMFQPADDMS
jgi:hypothetical protein